MLTSSKPHLRLTAFTLPASASLILLLATLFISRGISAAELCPPVFGDFECPLGFECTVHGHCVSNQSRSDQKPASCSNVRCSDDSRCVSGEKCLLLQGVPCDRNALVGKNVARSIRSDCGRRGRCVNGRCSIDKCHDVLCDPSIGELCRDGKCVKMLGAFCLSVFDCGTLPGWECSENRCIPPIFIKHSSTRRQLLAPPPPPCDPGEAPDTTGGDTVCKRLDAGCAQLLCEPGEVCMQGGCFPASLECAHDGHCPRTSVSKMVCNRTGSKRGLCVQDPCWGRCPPDHACNNGECRLLQGMLCSASAAEGEDPCEAHKGFYCINGLCVKDECHRKVCQIGERCETGLCVVVEGRICRDTERDCGEAFECDHSQHCRDKIWLFSGARNQTKHGTARQ